MAERRAIISGVLLRALLVASAITLCAVASPLPVTAHAALTVGFGDQLAGSWSDTRLRALGLRHGRLIVPWDAATTEPAAVHARLDAMAAAGVTPHVAFAHRRGDRCPSRPCVVPSREEYRGAVQAFRARFPQVATFTTWNEANHRVQPVAEMPEVVAGFYEELKGTCPSCTVVAGDVLDSGSYVQWLERFQAATTSNPQLWGVHNYGDVTYQRTNGTDNVLAAVPGELWVEETGGIVTLRSSSGRETLRTDEIRAAAAIDQAFAIARARPRITRMYAYHWTTRTGDPFDSAMTRANGSLRPSYTALQRGLAGLVPTAVAAPPPPARGARKPLWRITWSKARPGQLLVRITCQTVDKRCRGKVSAVARLQRRTGAKLATRRLATRRAYTTTKARPTVTIRVRVNAADRRRVRAAGVRRLRLTVRPSLPSGKVTTVTLRLAKPR